jgi:hypothetical protein
MITVQRADERLHTRIDWLDSWHSFSFGSHYHPDHVNHGLLLVNNDDRVAPSGGFGTHSHRDMEIVTWVLEGRLEHRDSQGNHGILYPGLAQRMSAGTGIAHSEYNASDTEPVHFIQMWVRPDTAGIAPGYEQRDLNDSLAQGGLRVIASGKNPPGAIHINQRDAEFSVARLAAGESVTIPANSHVHVFVARGDGRFDPVSSDVFDVAAGGGIRLTAHGESQFTATTAAEILVWATA